VKGPHERHTRATAPAAPHAARRFGTCFDRRGGEIVRGAARQASGNESKSDGRAFHVAHGWGCAARRRGRRGESTRMGRL